MNISSVFYQMVLLFLILAIGYGAAKGGAMSLEGNRHLSLLINCITNPCNVLYSAVSGAHQLKNSEVVGVIFLAVAFFGALILLSTGLTALLHPAPSQRGIYRFLGVFSNIGFIGIPVVRAALGEDAVFILAIFIMIFNLLAYTYGAAQIRGDGTKGKLHIRAFLTPMTVSALMALVLYLCSVQLPGLLVDTLNTISKATTPCAMLLIGCALSAVPLRQVFSNWRIYALSAVKLLVFPLLTYAVLRPLSLSPLILGTTVLVASMPAATNCTMLAAQYGKDQKLAATGVFLTTLFSVATIPALMLLLFG